MGLYLLAIVSCALVAAFLGNGCLRATFILPDWCQLLLVLAFAVIGGMAGAEIYGIVQGGLCGL